MDYKALFVVTLIFLSLLPVPVSSAEINPSVENQPFFCKYSVTKWLCKIGGGGTGTINLPDEINITEFNSFIQNTTITGDFYNNSNLSIWYTNITEANFIGDVWYYTYSEMNQTPNMTSGPTGPQGVKGDKGDKGDQGEQGPQGPQGVKGDKGDKGDQGEQGPPGATGAKGDKGDTGAQGPQGEQGPPGAANMTAGPQGEKGDKGDQGIQGPEGPMNQTANMTAGPPGLDANVSSMYPVNSVYWTTSTSNPNTLLGDGTWTPIYNISGTYSSNYTISACNASTTYKSCVQAYDNSIADNDNYRWVASAGAVQWVNFDLGSTKTIGDIRIFGYNSGTQTYLINTSTDGGVGTPLLSYVTPGQWTWSNRSFLPKDARFVRVVVVASSGWSSLGEISIMNTTAANNDAIYGWRRTS